MLSRDSEDEMWSRLVFEVMIWPQKWLWQDELNPRVRCAFGNVSLLCMFQYQASRQPWWTVSFWFWSRPSGWFLQTWDVLNIWYDNFIYDNYYFFCKISREKKQVFLTSDMFFAQFTGLWSQCSVHGHASSLTEAVGRHWHAVQHDKQPGKRYQIFLP